MTNPGFRDLANDTDIHAYFQLLQKAHGVIRLVDIISDEDAAYVNIDRLFIEPGLVPEHVSPDRPVTEWPRPTPVLLSLKTSNHVVVLGDPGSGKSTLVSWLTTRFARSTPNLFITELGQLIPVPMVLRELDVAKAAGWNALIEQFCNLPYLQLPECPGAESQAAIDPDRILELMDRGQVLVLLDGIDEVGSVHLRARLRAMVLDAQRRFPLARWIATSRIVGYSEVPMPSRALLDLTATHSREYRQATHDFIRRKAGETEQAHISILRSIYEYVEGNSLLDTFSSEGDWIAPLIEENPRGALQESAAPIDLPAIVQQHSPTLFVAPFDDARVDRYAESWYGLREPSETVARDLAHSLASGLRAHPHLAELSRNPILLAFLAFIHRREVRQHDGRAQVYGRIAEIFLERIPLRKNFDVLYRFDEKLHWLGRVALQLQARRMRPDPRPLIVSEEELVVMLAEAMAEHPGVDERVRAKEFLEFLTRKAGLLVPCGPSVFSFTHLSFQEFFAASAIREVASRRAFFPATVPPAPDEIETLQREAATRPISPEELALLLPSWADSASWSEVLLLCTELLDTENAEIFLRSCLAFSDDNAEQNRRRLPYRMWLVVRCAFDSNQSHLTTVQRAPFPPASVELRIP